jgi:hypothetical protein
MKVNGEGNNKVNGETNKIKFKSFKIDKTINEKIPFINLF